MKKSLKTLFLSIPVFFAPHVLAQYQPDVLPGYESKTIEMPDDYEGRVVCTVVRKKPNPAFRRAIVYVHGYNDYFFQQQLGDSAAAHGFNFYAVDLRKYGRSQLPHQDVYYCKSLKEYFPDIDTTIATARAEGNTQIILTGHSTGGLSTSFYLKEKERKGEPCPVEGLALNSPFLDWNFGWALENLGVPVVSVAGIFFKQMKVRGTADHDSNYSQSLLASGKGEWTYNTDWKLSKGHPVRAGWIRAINRAQKRVHKKKIQIPCPVLVARSDSSASEGKEWHNACLTTDLELSVDDIEKYGKRLSKKASIATIPDGIHDLILSPRPARDLAHQALWQWAEDVTKK